MRFKMRERELIVFQNALEALKNTAAYTSGDLYALLDLCRENDFLKKIPKETDIVKAWQDVSADFFSNAKDCTLAQTFIRGYGKTDLSGVLAYISLFQTRVQEAMCEAKQDVAVKCKLSTALGLFSGTVTALILI